MAFNGTGTNGPTWSSHSPAQWYLNFFLSFFLSLFSFQILNCWTKRSRGWLELEIMNLLTSVCRILIDFECLVMFANWWLVLTFCFKANESKAPLGNLFYSFNYGNVHVIALSSESLEYWHDSFQYEWCD
jgi:hypothetical protein